jgi:hypothetical protein
MYFHIFLIMNWKEDENSVACFNVSRPIGEPGFVSSGWEKQTSE